MHTRLRNTPKQIMISLLGATALLVGAWAHALEMGPIEVTSSLNEPLEAKISLGGTIEELEYAEASLASKERIKNAGIMRHPLLDELVILIVNNKGQSHIQITSNVVIKEPLLDILITVRWENGQLIRGYSILLSP
ncbi:FimV family protein [Pseudomonadota bacterium]